MKEWLIAAGVLVLVGCTIFVSALMWHNWEFANFSTLEYVTNEYTVSEAFQNISVESLSADVSFVASEDGKVTVTCYEQEKTLHTVTVQDGTLWIQVQDQRKWYDYIGVNFGSPAITVAVPAGEYGSFSVKTETGDVVIPGGLQPESVEVKVSTGHVRLTCEVRHFVHITVSTGDIYVENASMKVMSLRSSTGKINLTGVKCQERATAEFGTGKLKITDTQCNTLIAKGGTGDVTLKNVIAGENLTVKTTTGDVKLDGCDAGQIDITTNTGDVTGTLLSGKLFGIETKTGEVDVPYNLSGGNCYVTTSTGDVKITVLP